VQALERRLHGEGFLRAGIVIPLARSTAGVAALPFLETAGTCQICHVNLFLNLI
jgi:hypothetical protein